MKEIDFLSSIHKSTKRDYLGRVNNKKYPKAKAAELAKKFDYDYWDGDREICYGGYKYIEGRWAPVANALIKEYKLSNRSKILDIGCGKGFLIYELKKLIPEAQISGLDISQYAIENSKEEIKENLIVGNANDLPWEDDSFDLIISINTLHCLHSYDLEKALKEIERVGKSKKYICVESYRNEAEKANLLYWQVTCEAFNTIEEWLWWFNLCNYSGDYSFIFFE